MNRLVLGLGLQSSLNDYKVPKGDLPKLAAAALGTDDDPTFGLVVEMLEGLYSA